MAWLDSTSILMKVQDQLGRLKYPQGLPFGRAIEILGTIVAIDGQYLQWHVLLLIYFYIKY